MNEELTVLVKGVFPEIWKQQYYSMEESNWYGMFKLHSLAKKEEIVKEEILRVYPECSCTVCYDTPHQYRLEQRNAFRIKWNAILEKYGK